MFAYCNNSPVSCIDSEGTQAVQNTMRMSNDGGGTFTCNGSPKRKGSTSYHNAMADGCSSTTTRNRIINDQNGTTGYAFRFGRYLAKDKACEAIAVHNVKVLKGMDSTLSETIDAFMSCGAIWLGGLLGSNQYEIGKVLDYYNISYSKTAINYMVEEGTYIVSYVNEKAYTGIHTIAVTYDGQGYTAYNYYENDKGPFYPSEFITRSICVYYVG